MTCPCCETEVCDEGLCEDCQELEDWERRLLYVATVVEVCRTTGRVVFAADWVGVA